MDIYCKILWKGETLLGETLLLVPRLVLHFIDFSQDFSSLTGQAGGFLLACFSVIFRLFFASCSLLVRFLGELVD